MSYYSYIINPINGKQFNIKGKGKRILKKYIKFSRGGAAAVIQQSNSKIIKEKKINDEDVNFQKLFLFFGHGGLTKKKFTIRKDINFITLSVTNNQLKNLGSNGDIRSILYSNEWSSNTQNCNNDPLCKIIAETIYNPIHWMNKPKNEKGLEKLNNLIKNSYLEKYYGIKLDDNYFQKKYNINEIVHRPPTSKMNNIDISLPNFHYNDPNDEYIFVNKSNSMRIDITGLIQPGGVYIFGKESIRFAKYYFYEDIEEKKILIYKLFLSKGKNIILSFEFQFETYFTPEILYNNFFVKKKKNRSIINFCKYSIGEIIFNRLKFKKIFNNFFKNQEIDFLTFFNTNLNVLQQFLPKGSYMLFVCRKYPKPDIIDENYKNSIKLIKEDSLIDKRSKTFNNYFYNDENIINCDKITCGKKSPWLWENNCCNNFGCDVIKGSNKCKKKTMGPPLSQLIINPEKDTQFIKEQNLKLKEKYFKLLQENYKKISILLNNLRKIQIKVKLIECTEEKKLKSDYDTLKKSESKLDNLQVNIFEIENELEDLVTNSKRLLDFIKHY